MTKANFSLVWPDGRTQSFVLDLTEKPGQKKGGAGRIFPHPDDPSLIIKVYHSRDQQAGDRLSSYEQKISAMVNAQKKPETNDPLSALSWPLAILREGGKFCGFAMPKAKGELLSDVLHRQTTEWSLNNRLIVAQRLSSLIASIHKEKCQVVDLKPQNALVDIKNDSYVTLIDSDGLALWNGQFPPPQATDGYKLPEARRSKDWSKTISDWNPSQCEMQDRFALAVVLFQIWNHELHPFAGPMRDPSNAAAPSSLQDKINAGMYAYALNPNIYWSEENPLWDFKFSKLECSPQSDSNFDQLPSELKDLFDRAFNCMRNEGRPSAQEWSDTLSRYLSDWCDSHHMPIREDAPCEKCQAEDERRILRDIEIKKQQEKIERELSREKEESKKRRQRYILAATLSLAVIAILFKTFYTLAATTLHWIYSSTPNLMFAAMLTFSGFDDAENIAKTNKLFDPNKSILFRTAVERSVNNGQPKLINATMDQKGILSSEYLKKIFTYENEDKWNIIRLHLISWSEGANNALNVAIELENFKAIEWLNKNGLPLNGENYPTSPLQTATVHLRLVLFQKLIKMGASLDATPSGLPIGVWLIRQPYALQYFNIYLQYGGKFVLKGGDGKRVTLFSVAADMGISRGYWAPLQRLLKEPKISFLQEDQEARTSLRSSCRRKTSDARRPPQDVCARFR